MMKTEMYVPSATSAGFTTLLVGDVCGNRARKHTHTHAHVNVKFCICSTLARFAPSPNPGDLIRLERAGRNTEELTCVKSLHLWERRFTCVRERKGIVLAANVLPLSIARSHAVIEFESRDFEIAGIV